MERLPRAASILAGAFTPQVTSGPAFWPCAPPEAHAPVAVDSTSALHTHAPRRGPLLRISGSITALATPFNVAGELDIDAWQRLLAAQLEAGNHAFVLGRS